jgi:hypothetical protein
MYPFMLSGNVHHVWFTLAIAEVGFPPTSTLKIVTFNGTPESGPKPWWLPKILAP